MSPRTIHGRTVRAMTPVHLPAVDVADAIAHTLGHFLQPHEVWDPVPPSSALGSAAGRELLGDFAPEQWLRDHRAGRHDARWWRGPLRDRAIRIHDDGYAPRYFTLMERAGAAGSGAWRREPQGRWSRQVQYGAHEYKLVVAAKSADVYVMITAMESFRTRPEPGRAGPGLVFSPFAGLDRFVRPEVTA